VAVCSLSFHAKSSARPDSGCAKIGLDLEIVWQIVERDLPQLKGLAVASRCSDVSIFDLHSAVLADDRDFVRWFFAAVDDRA
jgi:hypothetical protein